MRRLHSIARRAWLLASTGCSGHGHACLRRGFVDVFADHYCCAMLMSLWADTSPSAAFCQQANAI
jgi:hypothetical protein